MCVHAHCVEFPSPTFIESMLNYVWISLIVIGILVAAGSDLNDEMKNTYRNDVPLDVTLEMAGIPTTQGSWEADLIVGAEQFNAFYGISDQRLDVRERVRITTAPSGESTLLIASTEQTAGRWRMMAKNATTKDKLTGRILSIRFTDGGKRASAQVMFEPIRFIKVKAITQAALEYAAIAVNIALGLIGIMALWLGVMKVAEEAGLVKGLTKLLTPLTKRLFPEVPPDHPAVGAMIMNISANMLGLSNAATPFGLKAMEELNKLNPKIGTATNAMCTFLVINTSGLVLIPATAIAVRAAAGSSNPGIIIGTSIFGAGCATIAGLISVKLLQRLRYFRKDVEVGNG